MQGGTSLGGNIYMRPWLDDVQDRLATDLVFSRSIVTNNFGVGGQNTPQMLGDVESQIIPLYRNGYQNVVLVVEGTNDMHLNGKTAQQAFESLRSYCTLLRQAGFKVVFISATPRHVYPELGVPALPASYDINRLNDLMRSASFVDAFADITAIPEIGGVNAAQNKAYYPDGVHYWTEAAYSLIVPVITQAVRSLLF